MNGLRIPAPTVLSSGDELAVGGSVLRIPEQAAQAAMPGAAPPPRPKQPALRVVEGWATGARIPIDEPVVLGNEAAGKEEFGGDPAIAPEHARVTPLGDGRVILEDLGSGSGTIVAGSAIPAPTVLAPGDRFQLGGQMLELIQIAGSATPRAAESKVAGGVRQVPEGLFKRIAGRAPVTKAEVMETYALALGWAFAANLLIRSVALEAADVPDNLTAIQPVSLFFSTLLPLTFNAFGFAKIFRRPDYRSVQRYLIPTFGMPALFVGINLARMNHTSFADVVTTVAVTVVPILICAPLMLRLRERVAMEHLRQVRA